jgi:NADH dehydrogenase/NADH:ubiquinone oxidoreductase subunit G
MNVVIDGKICEAKSGETLLAIARRNGIDIPTLCHHDALPSRGCCRLCIVEAEDAAGNCSVVISCHDPVQEGVKVYTKSDKIIRLRRTLLALLREQAPEAEGALPAYCREYGVTGGSWFVSREKGGSQEDKKCILCGLCSRACEALGNSAIQATQRGIDKVVAPPFNEPPQACVGCAACARVCPTNAVECLDEKDQRTIWGRTFTLVKCTACGKPFATADELEWLKKRLLDAEINLSFCPKCRRKVSLGAVSA